LVPAIRRGDIAALTQSPGVGRKTAERIVLELRDKLATMEAHQPSRAASPAGPVEDVISALINLGYERHAAETAVEASKQKGAPDFEVLLKAALQKLASPVERMARAAR
jgi:Holliday junction DNA helicase RuvA